MITVLPPTLWAFFGVLTAFSAAAFRQHYTGKRSHIHIANEEIARLQSLLAARDEELTAAREALEARTGELTEQKHFLQRVFDIAPVCIFVNGPVGNKIDGNQTKTLWANPQIKTLTGFTPEEVYALSLEEWIALFHPSDGRCITKTYNAIIQHIQNHGAEGNFSVEERVGEAWSRYYLKQGAVWGKCEYRVRHKDGSWRWLYTKSQTISDPLDTMYGQTLCFALDITTMKESRMALQDTNTTLQYVQDKLLAQAARIQQANVVLQSLNIEKTELMGIVAHDLKNPLGALRGFGEMLQCGLFTTEGEIQRAGEQIFLTSDRVLHLVKNLLDVNRLETGNIDFSLHDVPVLPIVEGLLDSFHTPADAKRMVLALSVDAKDKTARARMDESAFLQVMDNLVSNAIKYSPHGKRITVRLSQANNVVRIAVQDEGPGISAKDQQRLFGKFARLSAQPTGGEHSTGLGLSIVKKLVEVMNGRVWCESEFGNGATFVVELTRV